MNKYYGFTEEHFKIKNKAGKIVPFTLWNTQDAYMLDLIKTYGKDLQGVRDIILKARKEGFSSIILAIFAVDFLTANNPIASVCIADTQDETKKLFQRVQFFVDSAAQKNWPGSTIEDICDVVNVNEMRNKRNGATFWIGTAGSKMAKRVESVQNLHFSEAAHFPDTDIITARETIEGAMQMVELGTGRIFIESTARGYGNYYQDLWSKAENEESKFRSVFFGADELYTPQWLAEKRKEFTTDEMFWQEYPLNPEQAFMSSGSKFFDASAIGWLKKETVRKPLIEGNLTQYGELI